MTSVMKTVMQ